MTSHESTSDEPTNRHSRWLYARVLIVQVITLIALWILQSAYGGG